MTTRPDPPQVLGDPRIPWVVLLDVALDTPPPVDTLMEGLAVVAASAGWAPPSSRAVSKGSRRDLLGSLCSNSDDVLRVGLHDHGLVLAARHDMVDGLAILTSLGKLLGGQVRSSARGVEPEGRHSRASTALLGRAWEIAAQPPARVAGDADGRTLGDSFASSTVDSEPRTAELVHAGCRAVVDWNDRHRARARRVSVAVGVSTVGGGSGDLSDRSAFIRIRGVERLNLEEVRARLASAPLELGGFDNDRPRPLAAVAGLAFRVAAPRLGSTLLVSHLGVVDTPDGIDELAFYPVTGGGSGVSLGAATVRGRTTLTLRGRAAQHDDEGLQGLLALVVERLA
jgi:hypothetical protein